MTNCSSIICLCRETELEADPDFWLPKLQAAAREPLEVLKEDGDKRTLKAVLEPWGEVCLQDMEWNGLKKRLSFFRRTSGRTSWDLASSLADLHIPVVEPLLYLEIRKKGFVTHSCQVSRWLTGYNLGRLARERTPETEERLIALLEKASFIVSRLHRAGFIHGDLKWSNFLYIPGHDREIVLTDLDHVRRSGSPSDLGRDLARFVLSAAESDMGKEVEEALISRYLESSGPDADEVEKSLFRRLSRKRERYAKRGTGSRGSS